MLVAAHDDVNRNKSYKEKFKRPHHKLMAQSNIIQCDSQSNMIISNAHSPQRMILCYYSILMFNSSRWIYYNLFICCWLVKRKDTYMYTLYSECMDLMWKRASGCLWQSKSGLYFYYGKFWSIAQKKWESCTVGNSLNWLSIHTVCDCGDEKCDRIYCAQTEFPLPKIKNAESNI